MIDPQLASFATVRQLELMEAAEKHGSMRKAATALGLSHSYISRSMKALKRKAARQGYAPEHDMTRTVPDGFKVRGVSTYYNAEGKAAGQWVKSTADHERQLELMQEALEALREEIPTATPVDAPSHSLTALCNVYTLTDCHVGMLAWHREGGADWDLAIAEKTLVGCFSAMVQSSPQAETCVIAQLGDFLHYDSAVAAITPVHGHNLDADGRMPKMVRTAIRILRTVVQAALERHQRVILLLAEGNHDMGSSVWLRAMFSALYEAEPRVYVIDSELPYYVHQHGKTMIGWHHGHLSKNDALPLLFAAQFPQVWGSTSRRYVHCGHRHHVAEKEHPGMTVVQHPTIAARDAYAARGGWLSERQVQAITYHSEHGQVARNIVTPEMLQ